MEQSNQSKKVLLSVIGVAILVVAVVGVSFAFFNYTRTGAENSIGTGSIYFLAEQSGDITVENFFPTPKGATPDGSNSDSMTIAITAGTSYAHGIDYRLVAVDKAGSTNVPVKVTTSTSDAALHFSGVTNATLTDNMPLGTGHINHTTGGGLAGNRTTGTITVTAYLDGSSLAITDTPVESTEWVAGRTVINTTDWNSLATNPVTFKVRVIADEGAASNPS